MLNNFRRVGAWRKFLTLLSIGISFTILATFREHAYWHHFAHLEYDGDQCPAEYIEERNPFLDYPPNNRELQADAAASTPAPRRGKLFFAKRDSKEEIEYEEKSITIDQISQSASVDIEGYEVISLERFHSLHEAVKGFRDMKPSEIFKKMIPQLRALPNQVAHFVVARYESSILSDQEFQVFCGTPIIRSNDADMAEKRLPDMKDYAVLDGLLAKAHRDYTEAEFDAENGQRNLYDKVNIWMPLDRVVAFPLALLRSPVKEGDFRDHAQPAFGSSLYYTEYQQWVMDYQMDIGKAYLFKSLKTYHGAVQIDNQPDAAVRSSLDVRCWIFNRLLDEQQL